MCSNSKTIIGAIIIPEGCAEQLGLLAYSVKEGIVNQHSFGRTHNASLARDACQKFLFLNVIFFHPFLTSLPFKQVKWPEKEEELLKEKRGKRMTPVVCSS